MAVRRGSLQLTQELKAKDEELKGSPSLLGQSGLTSVGMIHGTRDNMFTSHVKQEQNLTFAEPPRVSTTMENLVGKYSSGYLQVHRDLKVIKKICKFKDELDSPNIYELFVYDEEKEEYDVIHRVPLERLTEKFAFQYNNETMDSYEVGDTIKKDTVLSKSYSYDDNMNYGFGKNVLTMYTLDPYTTEDAAVCSESLGRVMESIEADAVEMCLNDNDYLLNLYGDNENYVPLPKIGEVVGIGPIVAWRRLINDQVLFDFKASGLRKIRPGDTKKLINGDYIVLDYEIFNNAEEIPDNDFNHQLLEILSAQNKYYDEIIETCNAIIESGKNYTSNVDYLLMRAREFKDTEKKWCDRDNAFGNIYVRIIIQSTNYLTEGCKITGRCGNKSVVAVVRKDEDMPYTEDGRRVDLLLNLNAVINRTTAFAQYELIMSSIEYQVRQKMKTMKKLEDRANLFFEALEALSISTYGEWRKLYEDLDKKEKKAFIDEVMELGIYMAQTPLPEDGEKKLFDRINDFKLAHPWIHDDAIYTKRYGRMVKSHFRTYIGEMYIMKLKQTGKRGYIARSTGAIDPKGLCVRSHNPHTHESMFNNKPVHFGEQETINFLIGMYPIDLVLLHALLRTSTQARHDLVTRSMSEPKPGSRYFNIPKKYTSLVGQIAHVYLKSLGLEIKIEDTSKKVVPLDDTIVSVHNIHDKEYLCTDLEAHTLETVHDIVREIIVTTNRPLTKDEMREEVLKRLKKDTTSYGSDSIECIEKFGVI